MTKKIFILTFIFICFLFTTACKNTKPQVYLSTKPIAKDVFVPMSEFKKNDTINFILISPKGFQSDSIRFQLLKKSGLNPNYGFTLALGKDYNVENKHYITGGFTVYSAGRYELLFYDSDGTTKKTHFPAKQYYAKPSPIIDIEFGVYDE